MIAAAAWLGFVGTVVVANVLVDTFGVVPVGFGLMAPAAVYVVGLAFVLRDVLHELAPRWAVWAAIAAGTVLSVAVSPELAVASGTAFALSETLDLVVYERLRRAGRRWALLGSNVAGVVADSVVFLALAFASLEFLPGQVVGKLWITAVALVLWRPGVVLPRHT